MIKDLNLVIKSLLLFSVIVYSIYASHFVLTTDTWLDYKECGVVVGSSSEDRPIKHGTQTDLYLLMEYEHDGFQAQEVGPTTYFQYKDQIGKKLCFELTKRNPIMERPLNIIHFFAGCVSLFIYFIIILYLFVSLCFGDE